MVEISQQNPESHFGRGSFLRHFPEDFLNWPSENQARFAGWHNGCPVVESLIQERGAEHMLTRYGSVNFWFSFITEALEETRPDLVIRLLTPMSRDEGYTPSDYEPGSIHDSYLKEMPPLDTPVGYALPRVWIEQLKGREGSSQDTESVQARLVTAIESLEWAALYARSTSELLVLFGQSVVEADADPLPVLSHILPKGKSAKENAPDAWQEVIDMVYIHSPSLCAAYNLLTPEERNRHNIIPDADIIED